LRLPTGELNLAGDWAEEQCLIAQPPDGGPAGTVPHSGELTITERFTLDPE
jgi:hypothetical protein